MKINNVSKCLCCGKTHGSSIDVHTAYMQDVSKWILSVDGVWYNHGNARALNSVEYYNDASSASKAFDIEVASHK